MGLTMGTAVLAAKQISLGVLAPQAAQLATLIKKHDMAAHVNLIPWNPVDESEFQRPSRNGVFRFKNTLEEQNISASIRITRGASVQPKSCWTPGVNNKSAVRCTGLDAAAACGQLRNQYQKNPLQD